MKKILICGSRNLNSFNIDNYIDNYDIELVNGGAYGVDTLAQRWAERHGIKYQLFIPDYKNYGKFAPLKRDSEMVDDCDTVVAFWDGLSKGTKYTIEYALKRGKKVIINFMEDI